LVNYLYRPNSLVIVYKQANLLMPVIILLISEIEQGFNLRTGEDDFGRQDVLNGLITLNQSHGLPLTLHIGSVQKTHAKQSGTDTGLKHVTFNQI
jgi:hypothetical protein